LLNLAAASVFNALGVAAVVPLKSGPIKVTFESVGDVIGAGLLFPGTTALEVD